MQSKADNVLDGTTWEFLGVGWWISHVLALVLVAWLGYVFWPR